MYDRLVITKKYCPVPCWDVDHISGEDVRARVEEAVRHGDEEAEDGSPQDEDGGRHWDALGDQDIHEASGHTGDNSKDHSDSEHLVRLYRVDRDVEKREGVKHEGRLAD